ncbi:MAG: Molybdopterin-synthase adenylyltransferase [Candidatus Heimdallarchaeota archaeon LC_2]|nr:MAG: Molybdopterin-synthase adenylyltransferase [Candidatus Heimdallarchaeota archaeon LC_2]
MNESPEWLERYSRHFPLASIGIENQRLLSQKRILIAGMGGLGTVSSELLASIGIGYLRIVDFDVVEVSNLPRQKLYEESDIGKSKVDVAEEKLKLRNPNIEIDAQATRLDALSVTTLLEDIDLIIDALDSFSSRRVLHREAFLQKIPFIFTGAVAESANIMSFTFKDNTPCLTCVLGDIKDNPNLTCEITGVHPSILHLAAGIQVTDAIRILLNQPSNLESTMMFLDLESMEFEKIKFKQNPDCKLCGRNEEGELDSGEIGETTKGFRTIGTHGKALVTSLCGRDTIIIDPSWEIKWDFDLVRNKVKDQWVIAVEGKNYLTFKINDTVLSVLRSGVSTIRGSKSSKNAVLLYDEFYSYINQTSV